MAVNLETISAEHARHIIEMNKRGEKPETLLEESQKREPERPKDLLADTDISRFDKTKKKPNHANNTNKRRNNNAPRGERMGENNSQKPYKRANNYAYKEERRANNAQKPIIEGEEK